MIEYSTSIVIGVLLLLIAIPYVRRIRHREQKPIAAYFIFITVSGTAVILLFGLFSTLAYKLGLSDDLSQPIVALVFLALVFAPAVALGTWQARKPPWRRGPPN